MKITSPTSRPMRQALALFSFLLALLSARAALPCVPCGDAFITWGTRVDVCASPSEGLLVAAVECWCDTGCATECAGFCASYASCEASGDPACAFSGGTTACDECTASTCAGVTSQCSADTTGCVSCSGWLAGGNPDAICVYDPLNAAIALSQCACLGACAHKCGGACGGGYLEPPLATTACENCLLAVGKGCGSDYAACVSM